MTFPINVEQGADWIDQVSLTVMVIAAQIQPHINHKLFRVLFSNEVEQTLRVVGEIRISSETAINSVRLRDVGVPKTLSGMLPIQGTIIERLDPFYL